MPKLTLAEFVPVFLERHIVGVRPRTIDALRWRLGIATKAFGDVPLRDLERMTGELAAWQTTLPTRSRFAIMAALRQALGAAVRWGYIATNPAVVAGRNRQPSPRPVRAFSPDELDAIAAELAPSYRPLPIFAAASGLRPEEWQALERHDLARQARILNVRRTVSSGEVVGLAKTDRSRRQVPLSSRALDALDRLPPRLDTPLLFPATRGGVLNPRQFPSPCMGASDRGRRHLETGSYLRPALDLRLRRARRWSADLHARPDHGHKRAHDRATLRRPTGRSRCRHC